jgi:cyclohexadienyl dehydratase
MGLKFSWDVRATSVLLLVLSAAPAGARTLAAIKADGMLRVGLTGDYAPYALRGPDGKITGADVSIAQALTKNLGVELKIVPTTWKFMTRAFEAGDFDIVMGGVTADRALIGNFSKTIMSDGRRPIVRCVDKDHYVSITAINQPGVRVAVNPGGTNRGLRQNTFPEC